MKAAAFDWQRARDAAHAVALLAQAGANPKIVAGGQSLGPMLNLRLARPSLLVDVSACEDLRGVVDEGDALVYGAAITHAEIEDGRVPDALGGPMAAAARHIAYRAVRNRGTIGGSLAHADPAADWPTVLLASGAEVVIHGAGGLRAVALADFVTGPFATRLGEHEVLVGVRVKRRGDALRWGYRKVSVKTGEFAHAFAVAMADPETGERRAVIGAIERVPLVLEDPDPALADTGHARDLLAARLPFLTPTRRHAHAATLARVLRDLDAPQAGA